MMLFLHGPDSYRVRGKLKEIQEKYLATYPRAVGVHEFDCLDAKLQEAKTSLETLSIFEQKKLLVFRNVFQNSAFEEFLAARKEQLAQSERDVAVLVETGEIKAKTTNKFYQWLRKHAPQQEFLPLSGVRLTQWIAAEFARYRLKATPRALEALARSAGNDLWRLSGEVRKIAAWKKGEGMVRESDIALLVAPALETDVFSTVDEIARKNKKESFTLLHRHLQKGDSPHYVFAMLVYQFRTILQIKDMAERKLLHVAMAKRTKLHPYVLKKGLRVAQLFSLAELKAVYEKLFSLDKHLKTGKTEPEAAFDLLIASL